MDGAGSLPENIRSAVLDAAKPDDERRSEILKIASDLIDRVEQILHDLSREDVRILLVGSVSKGTMTVDPDIDIFLLFPSGTDLCDLERVGLEVGSAALTDARKKYTQHPYMAGSFMGMNADIVPCMSISRGSKVVTAVDRTPYHTQYVNENLRADLRDDVILLKSFLKGVGAYGAEDVVCGFSGYMVELMIIRFGGFQGVLEYLASLRFEEYPPDLFEVIGPNYRLHDDPDIHRFDSEPLMREIPFDETRYRRMFENDVMIFIDPVDRSRNVASPISAGTLSHVNHMARILIKRPSEKYFWPFSKRPTESGDAGELFQIPHGFAIHAIDLPGENPGIVISQLRRSLGRCRDELYRSGFESIEIGFILITSDHRGMDPVYFKNRGVLKVDSGHDRIAILLRTRPTILDRQMTHWGPPMDNKRADDFRTKWSEHHTVLEKDGRLYILLERKERDPVGIMARLWDEISHGTALKGSILIPVMEKEIFNTDITRIDTGNGIE